MDVRQVQRYSPHAKREHTERSRSTELGLNGKDTKVADGTGVGEFVE